MSQPVQPPERARTDLETVVRWPLIYAASAAVLLPLLVVAGLAIFSALRPAPRPAVARQVTPPRPKPRAPARRVKPPEPEPARPAEPIELGELKLNPSVGWAKPVRVRAVVEAPPPPVVVAAPLPPAKTAPVTEDEPPRFKRLSYRSEYELLDDLRKKTQEVDLRDDPEAVAGLLKRAPAARPKRASAEPAEHPLLAHADKRPDLRGLPLLRGRDCLGGKEATAMLDAISKKARRGRLVAPARRPGTSYPPYEELKRGEQMAELLRKAKEWRKESAVSALVQVFGTENPSVRTELVKALEGTKGRKATAALARLAVFDLSALVRQDAVAALKKRPAEDVRPALLSALRYPWAPAADHAAEALVALNDRGAVKELRALLSQPDPRDPYRDKDRKWKVREVVRVNHLRNCLLCHAPSPDRTDPVRALVPTPGEPLPVVYYAAGKGTFVRADVTYLRQDFSCVDRVDKPDKWPEYQRFDYVVRTRELTEKERARLPEPPRARADATYPQREAVQFALAELTAAKPKPRRD
jgi:hypothetical protein